MKYTAILLFLTFSTALTAQQLPYQVQFRQMYSYINPASVNSDYFLYEYNTALNTSYRMQWSAHPQTPRTIHASVDFIHDNHNRGRGFNLASGVMLLQDRTGPLSLTGAHVRIASLFAEDPYLGAFSLGFNAGATQYRLQHERILWEDLTDGSIPTEDIATTRPEVGVGAFYYKRLKKGRLKGDNIYAGLSVPQLLAARVQVQSGTNQVPVTRVPHVFFTGGWYHFFNAESFLETTIWVKDATGARTNVHLLARFQPMRTFWVGGGFNPNGLVHLEAGFNLPGFLAENGALKIGYAYDYNITTFELPFGSSHELHLSYLFDTRR